MKSRAAIRHKRWKYDRRTVNGLSMGNMVTEEEYAGISIKEHEAIYEAIKAHDVQLAQRRMYEHIMRSRDDMLTYYV